MLKKIFSIAFVLATFQSNAQTVLTLQPNGAAGKDAMISNFPGDSATNFGTSQDFLSESGSVNFYPKARRGLLQFDLTSIPSNATVISAYLSLYGTGGHIVANNNGAFLYRVTQTWDESTVTWITQPAYTTVNNIYLKSSDSSNQSYLDIDVRNILQDMVANPATSFGFLFKQKYECTCVGKMKFASSDYPTASMRPRLVVTWAVCNGNYPGAALSPGGPTTICYGTSQVFTANTGTGFTYQWFKNGVFVNGGSSNTFSAGSSGSYTVKVTNSQGCTAMSVTDSLNVLLDNAHITTDFGSTTQGCANGGLTMNATTGAGNTYQWLLNGNYYFGTSSSLTTSTPGNYSCYMTNGSCNYTTNTIASIEQVALVTTAGSNYFCTGGAFDIYLNFNIGFSETFQWQNNGVDIPGANGPSYSATTTGNYNCIIDDLMCAGNTITPTYTVTAGVSPHIEISSSIPGNPVGLCPGKTTDLNVIDQSTGQLYPSMGIEWYKDGSLISNDPALFYVSAPGTYTAYLNTTCGLSSSGPLDIISNSYPSAFINHSGSTSFCSGGSVILNAPASANYVYQWRKNGTDIPGAILSNYSAVTGGTYKVNVTNSLTGCSKTSGTGTSVTIYSLPTATATPQGPTTFCNGDSVLIKANYNNVFSYQWKKNNTNISGATTNKYVAKTAGNYKVKITNANGCTNISPVVAISVPCREDEMTANEKYKQEVNVYPNPSSGDFIFEIQNPGVENVTIIIYDVTGRLIDKEEIKYGQQIHLAGIKPGIYNAVITHNENIQRLRLVKNQ